MLARGVLCGWLSLALIGCSSVTPDPVVGDGVDGGAIEDPGQNAGCQGGSDLVYVVDSDNRLLSFDPTKVGQSDPFSQIGTLSCPAGAAYPDIGETAATPFSMSVDRSGTAWVLYSSGEVFKVSTANAACTPSNFSKGQKGFEVFGMGFVSNTAGSNDETLFVAGGEASQLSGGSLGTIDTSSLQVTDIAPITAGDQNPEMTGTGDGELYGFFPGLFTNFIARLDKSSGAVLEQWDLNPPTGAVSAWAFAHWGGKFYMFVTTEGLIGPGGSTVTVYDPATGMETVAVANSPYRVVGAGVSTCAPIVVK